MVTNSNNTYINQFIKGMNTDTSVDKLENSQYVFGQNIRIAQSALQYAKTTPNNKRGIVTPVHKGVMTSAVAFIGYERILAHASIEDLGAVILREGVGNKDTGWCWSIYKVEHSQGDSLKFTKIFKSNVPTKKDRFSVTMIKQVDSVITLYIADGEHQIMQINIKEDESYLRSLDVDDLISNHIYPYKQAVVTQKIAGTLTTSQVQYAYRLYKKHGIYSRMSPFTKRIQIVDAIQTKEGGNAEDTRTGIGLQLQIDLNYNKLKTLFDNIQLYRMQRIKPDGEVKIYLITDTTIPSEEYMRLNDDGKTPLKEYTPEEFDALGGLDIVPKCIETTHGYMFASNIQDNTTFKVEGVDVNPVSVTNEGEVVLYKDGDYGRSKRWSTFSEYQNDADKDNSFKTIRYNDINTAVNKQNIHPIDTDVIGGASGDVSWKFITTPISLHDNYNIDNGHDSPTIVQNQIKPVYYIGKDGKLVSAGYNSSDAFAKMGVESACSSRMSYKDMFVSSLFRSLRRNEVYRYGVVFYDKFGRHSDAVWFQDIRTPNESEFPSIGYSKDQNDDGPVTEIKVGNIPVQISSLAFYAFERSGGSYSDKVNIPVVCQRLIGDNPGVTTVYTSMPYLNTYWNNPAVTVYETSGENEKISYSSNVFGTTFGAGEKNNSNFKWYRGWFEKPVSYKPDKHGVVLLDECKKFYDRIYSTDEQLCKTNDPFSYEIPNGKSSKFDVQLQFRYEGGYSETTDKLYKIENGKKGSEVIKGEYIDLNDVLDYYGNRLKVTPRFSVKQGLSETSRIDTYLAGTGSSWYEPGTQISIGCVGVTVEKDVIGTTENKQSAIKFSDVRLAITMYEKEYKEDSVQNGLLAYPIGIEFKVNTAKYPYYQIVRCSKDPEYRKNLYQVALSRPMHQRLLTQEENPGQIEKYSPYYPTPFLTTTLFSTFHYYDARPNERDWDATNEGNELLFQAFTPNMNVQRETVLDVLSGNTCTLHLDSLIYGQDFSQLNSAIKRTSTSIGPFRDLSERPDSKWFDRDGVVDAYTPTEPSSTKPSSTKSSLKFIQYYYHRTSLYANPNELNDSEISVFKDVKNPEWNDGFSNVQIVGESVRTGIKQYKSYATSIDTFDYNNWVSNGMYDLRLFDNETQAGVLHKDNLAITWKNINRENVKEARGWIGPGPICMLMKLKTSFDKSGSQYAGGLYSLLCSIQHDASQFAGLSASEKQYDIYYGFGSYGTSDNSATIVFDGDVYINTSEFVNMFKTYNFNSLYDTIPSVQFVYYIPMESTINTMLDYGMNYTNTQNDNLMLEPGEITGIATQDRPLHQYNLIYSNNSVSDEFYNAESLQEDVNNYPHRIFFSSINTSTEDVSTYTTFKALDYIDAETRYGEINDLLAVKDTLYFWQSQAFGKLSVNERSLVTDNNNNTVQLGQGGVLQRTDYLDTKHGMRDQDYSAIAVDNSVFWIDILNKSIMAFSGQVANYGTAMNVQNYINSNINPDKHPVIDYDVEHGELLCQFDKNDNQLVFNTQAGIAQGVYTRKYDDTIQFNNTLFGLHLNTGTYTQYNNLDETKQAEEGCYLTPTVLSFVVNANPEITKVFDNQQIVTLKRSYTEEFEENFMKSRVFEYTTDLTGFTYDNNEDQLITDREGNILYAIPRIPNDDGSAAQYGNRVKGKWMNVTMTDKAPRIDYSISEILTKYRQSYS